jgi:hypothetical protein
VKRRAALTLLGAAALLGLAPAAAQGHGAAPQKAVETIEIKAAAERVWAIVGDFQETSWLPGVVRAEGEGDSTPERARRRLTFANGGTIDERLVQYDPADMSLRYMIERGDFDVLPVGNLSATIKVSGVDGGARVEWKSRFYRAFPGGNPPERFTDEIAIAAVSAYFKAGLLTLKAKAEGP